MGPHSEPHLGRHFAPFGAPFRLILGPLGALFEQHFRLFWLSFPGPLGKLIFWSFGALFQFILKPLCANLWAPRSLSWTPLQSCLPFQVVLWYLSGPRGAVLASLFCSFLDFICKSFLVVWGFCFDSFWDPLGCLLGSQVALLDSFGTSCVRIDYTYT